MGNHRLHDCGEREAENQRPQDFPSHGERHAKRTQDRFRHRPLPCPLEPSKSNTIKIDLIDTTRAINISQTPNPSRSKCTALTRQTQQTLTSVKIKYLASNRIDRN